MARIKFPLFVIVDRDNKALDTANTLKEARAKAGSDLDIKLYADHKGDKSLVIKE